MNIAEVIPAIDLLDGKVVRLFQGQYESAKYYDISFYDLAVKYKELGYKWLHIVDLSAARYKTDEELETYLKSKARLDIYQVLSDIRHNLGLKIEFCGGNRFLSVSWMIPYGTADRICIGSKAYTDPDFFNDMTAICGVDNISLGMDLMDDKISIHGWKQTVDITWQDFILNHKDNIRNIVCTNISKDGTMTGISIDFYKKIIDFLADNNINCNIIASGGVIDDNLSALYEVGIKYAIMGKSLIEKIV